MLGCDVANEFTIDVDEKIDVARGHTLDALRAIRRTSSVMLADIEDGRPSVDSGNDLEQLWGAFQNLQAILPLLTYHEELRNSGE